MAKSSPRRRRSKGRDITLANLSPADKRKLEQLHKKWQKKMEPMRKAIRESERITAKDLAVRINAKPF